MAKNIQHLQHVKSSVVENGAPKLPQPSVLVEGEIAVNYADGYETLSIKTSSGNIATFSSDTIRERDNRVIAEALIDLAENKLDASAYTPTDLSNYYTKDETSGASEISEALSAKADTTWVENKERAVAAALVDLDERKADASGVTDLTQAVNTISGDVDTLVDQNEVIAAALVDLDDRKMDTLVSGESIKTINQESLLGSGDIAIESGFKKFTNPTASTKVGLVNSLVTTYDTNIGNLAVIEGSGCTASGNYSHAEGRATTASGVYSHAEGYKTSATTANAHAEGNKTIANGQASHAEGWETKASGNYSHAEGWNTSATTNYTHAEGSGTTASGLAAHAEGNGTTASGQYSHAEGNETKANGQYSHAEGYQTSATTNYTHAEGKETSASGGAAHAEGNNTTASGQSSHAEGSYTTASGDYSHAEGYQTKATNKVEHASGQYNISSTANTTFGNNGNTLFSVGNGYNTANTHNAFEIRQNGDVYIANTDETTHSNYYQKDMYRLQDAVKAFGTVNANATAITATNAADAFTITGGTFLGVTADTTNKKITLNVKTGATTTTVARGSHNHASSAVTAMTSYNTSGTDALPIATSDTLNTAVRKLENGLNEVSSKLNNLSIVKMTQAEYNALSTKDPNTIYIVV